MNIGRTADGPEAVRVLHVVPNLDRGGAARVVATLLDETGSLPMSSFLCVLGHNGPAVVWYGGVKEPFFLAYRGSRRDVRAFARCVRALREVVHGVEPDIVHSHLWPAAQITGFTLRSSRIPHVVHVHDTRPWLSGRSIRDRMLRAFTLIALGSKGTSFIAVAEAVRRYTVAHLPWMQSRISVVHNGIDVEEFRARADNSVNASDATRSGEAGFIAVGTAGRLVPEKGQDTFLLATARLQSRKVRLKVKVAGEGSARRTLEHKVEELDLGNSVDFLGTIDDMPSFYAGIDIFVLPSLRAEGLPLTLLEAMASGCAVISTDVAGVSEVIRDEVDGLLVGPGDPVGMAQAIERLCRYPELREQLRLSGQRRVSNRFTGRRMAKECFAHYRRILGRG